MKLNSLNSLLKIQKGVTSLIGGGGKTTLMLTLADELASFGSVIVTTSTKIMLPANLPLVLNSDEKEIKAQLGENSIICVASLFAPNKFGMPKISFSKLQQLADFVLVEADGAKMLPLKAHAIYEPVIPVESKRVIYVVGIDGIGKSIKETCHRPELYASLANASLDTLVSEDIVAAVIKKENFGDTIFVNKVETPALWCSAKKLSSYFSCSVIAGSLWKGEYKCLH